MTWIDIDIADAQERAWLVAWKEISDQAKSLLLEPVRLSHREHLVDGMFLSVRTMRAGETDDVDHLTDLKLLLGRSRAITVRTGDVEAVDELRRFLQLGRSLMTAMDLLGFMVSRMTKRMEAVIFDLTGDTDAMEDQLLDSGSLPSPQAMNELRRRIIRIRRQLSSLQQVLRPIATDPALTLDADEREMLIKSSNHVSRYAESLEDCRERIQMLQDQIEAQRATTINRSSLNLTIVATVFLPLTFVSGLLGMNVSGIPEEHNPWAFWVVTGSLIIVALLAWLALRQRTQD